MDDVYSDEVIEQEQEQTQRVTQTIYLDSEYSPTIYNTTENQIVQEGFPITVQVSFGRDSDIGAFYFVNRNVLAEYEVGIPTGIYRCEETIFYDPHSETPFQLLLGKMGLSERLTIDPSYKRRRITKANDLPVLSLVLSLHYSPKDIEYFCGTRITRDLYAHKIIINQNGRLKVESDAYDKTVVLGLVSCDDIARNPMRGSHPPKVLLKLRIEDTYAFCRKSLDAMANLVGGTRKQEIAHDKSDMLGFAKSNPNAFRSYAMTDVLIQEQVSKLYPVLFAETFTTAIPDLRGKSLKNKGSMGANISGILEKIIENLHPDLVNTIALIRGGEIKEDAKPRDRFWRNMGLARSKTLGLSNRTSVFGAIVNGGRCRNEQPWRTSAENVLDVDMSGCYSTALKSMLYPIGLPTIHEWDHDEYSERRMTLGKFMSEYGDELIDDLWIAVIEGSTSFAWDVMPSLKTTPEKIRKSFYDDISDEERIRRIDGDYCNLGKEIHNGIMTASLYKLIKAVASPREFSEISNLHVKTAIYYPASERKATLADLIADIKANPGMVETKVTKYAGKTRTRVEDNRNKSWWGYSLGNIIDPLYNARKELKGKSKDPSISDEERIAANGKQELLKLGMNTLYGVLVSPYFRIGNVVVGNNITANARSGMWLLAKSLGCFQSITDGGAMSIDEVRYFKGYKPSLQTFYNQREWPNRDRSIGKLELIFKDDGTPDYDLSVENHINSFFEPYGLKLAFRIECKTRESGYLADKIGFMNKGDYMIVTGDEELLKKRGYRQNDENEPPAVLMRALAHSENIGIESLTNQEYTMSSLCGLNTFNVLPNGVMPGDELVAKTRTRIKPTGVACLDTSKDLEKFRNYFDNSPSGLEAIAKTTHELTRLLDELYTDPFQVLNQHRDTVAGRKPGRKVG